MMPGRSLTPVIGLATVAAFLAACNKSPTSPSTTLPGNSAPSAGPTPTRIEIVVPESLPPGESAQLTATAFLSDGSDRNVTSEAEWRSGDASVLSISNTGLATAHRTGDIFVRAAFNGKQSGQREVLVLPTGTYKVGGNVKDDEVPVPEARVEITAGSAVGLLAVTSRSIGFGGGGTYSLLGVSGDTEFRVTKDGYHPLVRTVRVTSHQQINFDLTPAITRADLSGTYTLTISPAADCRFRPEDVGSESYTAVLTQNLARLTVTLGGANFVSAEHRTYNSFQGVIEPSRIWFQLWGEDNFQEDPLNDSLPNPDAPFPDVSVQLTPSTFLFVGGLAIATNSPTGISGTLNGVIQTLQWVGLGPPRPGELKDWRQLVRCRNTSHGFVLSR